MQRYKSSYRSTGSSTASSIFSKGKNLFDILALVYPLHSWLPWKFVNEKLPSSFWKNIENQRWYLETLREELGMSESEFTSKVSNNLLLHHRGSGLLKAVPDIVSQIQRKEGEQRKSSSQRNSSSWWNLRENQLQFIEQLKVQFAWDKMTDLYKLTAKIIKSHGGAPLLVKYNHSPNHILSTLYPTHTWEPWKFSRVPLGWWNKRENQLKYIEWLKKEMNLTTMEDLYTLTFRDVVHRGGSGFLKANGNSLYRAISAVYPHHNWLRWKFALPHDYWSDPDNRREFLNELRRQSNTETLADFIAYLNSRIILENGGVGLLDRFKGSISALVKDVYGDTDEVYPWSIAKSNFWQNPDNKRLFFETLRQKMNWTKMEDLYNISAKAIASLRGLGVLAYHSESPALAVMATYPEHNWQPWRFKVIPRKWWEQRSNQMQYMQWLKSVLNYKNDEDWYNLTYREIMDNQGRGLLELYNYSVPDIVMNVFSDKEWIPWKFTLPRKYWHSRTNQLAFLNYLGQQLGYNSLEDFYQLRKSTVCDYGGSTLLNIHDESIARLLKSVFKDHNWLPWKFAEPPRWWTSAKNRKEFLEYVSRALGIETLDQMYILNADLIAAHGGRPLLYKFSIPELLQEAYPHHKWDAEGFAQTYQVHLKKTVEHVLDSKKSTT